MRLSKTLGVCALFAVTASGAQAAQIIFSDIVGQWSNPVGGLNITYPQGTGFGDPTEIRWGTTNPANNSGYRFDPLAGSIAVDSVNTTFDLGTFTHFNQPIFPGTSITGVDLKIRGDIGLDTDDDNMVDFVIATDRVFDFSFIHNETPNTQNGPGNQCVEPVFDTEPCGDLVSVNIVNSTDDFVFQGVRYTLEIFGFTRNGNFETTFFSDESQNNSGLLQARFSSEAVPNPNPVPLPAGLPLVLTGLGAMGLATRRKRK